MESKAWKFFQAFDFIPHSVEKQFVSNTNLYFELGVVKIRFIFKSVIQIKVKFNGSNSNRG